jgi:hypothetical protein
LSTATSTTSTATTTSGLSFQNILDLKRPIENIHFDGGRISRVPASLAGVCEFESYLLQTYNRCKIYNCYCLLNEPGFSSISGNPTYTRNNLTKDEILQTYLCSLNAFNICRNHDQFENCIKVLANKNILLCQ